MPRDSKLDTAFCGSTANLKESNIHYHDHILSNDNQKSSFKSFTKTPPILQMRVTKDPKSKYIIHWGFRSSMRMFNKYK